MAENRYTHKRHDIGLAYSGVNYGLMLAKESVVIEGEKRLVPAYYTLIDEYLAEQQTTGVPGYEHLPVEKELAMVYDDWRSGFGEDTYDSNDPKRYNASYGMDLRFKNRVILSNGATAIAVPSTTAPTAQCVFNGKQYVAFGIYLKKLNATGDGWTDVKTFASPITDMKVFKDGFMYIALESTQVIENCEDNWTTGTHGTPTLDTGDYKVGSGSVKIVAASAVAGDVLAYEDFTSADFSAFTGITLWIKVASAVAASDLTIGLTSTSQGIQNINLPAVSANIWTKVYARMTTPAYHTDITRVGLEYNANPKANTIRVDDIRAEESYWYMDAGETFTQSTLAITTYDSFAKLFCPVGNTMWKYLPPNKIYSSTDPSNVAAANWSSAYTVGSADYNINAFVTDGSTPFMIKGDNPYYVNTTPAVAVLTQRTRAIASSTSGTNSYVWDESLYMPYGTASLLERDEEGNFTWLDPAQYSTAIGDYDGTIQAIAGDEEWLFPVIGNSPKVEVLAGRWENVEGLVSWVWHPIQELTLAGCAFAWVSSVYQKRLWIASTSGSDSLYYIPLYSNYGDVVNDSNCAYATNGYFTTPKLHGNFKGDNKAFIKVSVGLGHAYDADIYFECHYKKEGDSSWTDAGDLKGTATNRVATLYLPDDASGNDPVSRSIQLKFVGKTDDTAKTPIMLWYDVRAILYAPRRNAINCIVRCADGILDKLGSPLGCTAAEIATWLEAASTATYPVTFYDIYGTAKYVRVLSAQPFSRITNAEQGRNPERHFNLLLEEVQLS